MDFALSEVEKQIQDTARQLAEQVIAPRAAHVDATSEFPHDNVKKLAELGFLGMMVAEQYGGAGLSTMAYVLAMEEISAACASTGVIMSVNNSLICHPIETFGSEEQKRKYLPKLASGEWLGSFCLTEPGAGSDAARQKSTAVKKGDTYVLNGTKTFITNGQYANVFLIFLMTDPSKGVKGITCFIVDGDNPGLARGPKEKTMGIHGSSTCQIILTDCVVPAGAMMGKEGEGFKIAMSTLDGGRIGIAAQAVGICAAALKASIRYAGEREEFGVKIGQFQAIQWMLADMATDTQAARLLTWQAAAKKDSGQRYTTEAAVAKLVAGRAAVNCTDRAVQIHGGYGYIQEYPVERLYRDAKITEIYEGTAEMQRLIIAGALLR